MAPTLDRIKTVLVIGPAGNVGKPTVEHLLAKGFTVSGLARDSSQATLPPGVTHIKTDYSLESLKAAFKGQDAVVSTVSAGGFEFQNTIIDAAIAAGVKILLPSEYGTDTSQPRAPELLPLLKVKVETMDYLKSKQDQVAWAAIIVGSLFDWGLDIPSFGGLDVPARTATIYDGGNTPYEATTLDQTGRAIAAALQRPNAIKNQYIYVNSFTVTQNEVIKALEKATSEKFVTTQDTIENLRKNGYKQLEEGNSNGMMDLIASVFYEDFGLCNYSVTKRLWNADLEIGQEDLNTVVQSYIASRK
ncbi:hypothetical protein ANO11243_071290 [Dothideomycetidae sp. 11243]|nr:hypothetical protein ANO11243_071290 [fungal sp. No.11243]